MGMCSRTWFLPPVSFVPLPIPAASHCLPPSHQPPCAAFSLLCLSSRSSCSASCAPGEALVFTQFCFCLLSWAEASVPYGLYLRMKSFFSLVFIYRHYHHILYLPFFFLFFFLCWWCGNWRLDPGAVVPWGLANWQRQWMTSLRSYLALKYKTATWHHLLHQTLTCTQPNFKCW